MEDVAGGDSERQLDESDGDAEIDRDDARNEDDSGENGGELNCIHDDLLLRFRRGHQPVAGRLGASLIARAESIVSLAAR